MRISKLFAFSAIAWLPLQFINAASPSPAIADAQQAHTQVIPIACENLFRKVIETLVANDCIILTADQQLGIITFRTQSEDNTVRGRRHVNILEGTLLLKPELSTSTRIRATLTLSWQEADRRTSFVTGVQKNADSGYYKWLFEILGKSFTTSN